jgi:hypothetical protein
LLKKAISFRGVEEATSTYKVKSFNETCFQVSQYQNQLGFGPEGNLFLGHDFWCNCCDDSRDTGGSYTVVFIIWVSRRTHFMSLVSCTIVAQETFLFLFFFWSFFSSGRVWVCDFCFRAGYWVLRSVVQKSFCLGFKG